MWGNDKPREGREEWSAGFAINMAFSIVVRECEWVTQKGTDRTEKAFSVPGLFFGSNYSLKLFSDDDTSFACL